MVSEILARTMISAAHEAWSDGDVGRLLRLYHEDLIYVCNGTDDGEPVILHGREQMRAFLEPVVAVAESMSTIDSFKFHEGVARLRCSCFIRHRATGHSLTGTYRQLVQYSEQGIARLDEYHDVARMAAFWRMVNGEDAVFSAGTHNIVNE